MTAVEIIANRQCYRPMPHFHRNNPGRGLQPGDILIPTRRHRLRSNHVVFQCERTGSTKAEDYGPLFAFSESELANAFYRLPPQEHHTPLKRGGQ